MSFIVWIATFLLSLFVGIIPFHLIFGLIFSYAPMVVWTILCVIIPLKKMSPNMFKNLLKKKEVIELSSPEIDFDVINNILSKYETNKITSSFASTKKIAKKGQIVAKRGNHFQKFYYVMSGALVTNSRRYTKGNFANIVNVTQRLALRDCSTDIISDLSRTKYFEIDVFQIKSYFSNHLDTGYHFYKYLAYYLILEFVTLARSFGNFSSDQDESPPDVNFENKTDFMGKRSNSVTKIEDYSVIFKNTFQTSSPVVKCKKKNAFILNFCKHFF